MSLDDFVFRQARQSDCELLCEWRNDPLTRQASVHTEVMSPEAMAATFAIPGRKVFVAEHLRCQVGTMRTDEVDGATELSWTVAPAFRGSGVGTAMVRQFAQSLPQRLIAQVKPANEASQRIALHAGFERIGVRNGLVQFQRQPIESQCPGDRANSSGQEAA